MSIPSPKDFFSRHAKDYARSASHAKGDDLARLIELLKPRANEEALDVATGTGFTAVALAPLVRHVTAVDITAEMLAEGVRIARQGGISNITFEEADAGKLPYPDGSFDILTCRRAPHHFRDVGAFLREGARILRTGGRLGVADMSPVEGTQTFVNLIEIIRDRTHVRGLTRSEWEGEFRKAGLEILSSELLPEYVQFEKWLYPVPPGGEEERGIRKKFESAPENVTALMEAKVEGKNLVGFVKTRIVIVGVKGAG